MCMNLHMLAFHFGRMGGKGSFAFFLLFVALLIALLIALWPSNSAPKQ